MACAPGRGCAGAPSPLSGDAATSIPCAQRAFCCDAAKAQNRPKGYPPCQGIRQTRSVRRKAAASGQKGRALRRKPVRPDNFRPGQGFALATGGKNRAVQKGRDFPRDRGAGPFLRRSSRRETPAPFPPKVLHEKTQPGGGTRGCFPRSAVVFLWNCVGKRPARAQFARRASTAACRRRSVSFRPSMAARSVPPPGVRLLPDRAMPSG